MWRDGAQAPVPMDYGDPAAMVGLARRVRNRVVEFDWGFLDEDLRALRRVGYDWARQGFSARVVAAINAALDEPDSRYAVHEPESARGLDGVVSCALREGRFRLHGHAPFDVVFGYLQGVLGPSATRERVGARTCATIENAARALGWNPERLAEVRAGPFWCALFGLAVGDGEPPLSSPTPSGPGRVLAIDFRGPLPAVEDAGVSCRFSDPSSARSGVYLWSAEAEGRHRALCVGQTHRSFAQRMAEHISAILTGQYDTLDLEALADGRPPVLWRGGEGGQRWPRDLPRFLARPDLLTRKTLAMLRGLRFHLAVVDGDAHRVKRVEGALGR